MEIKIKGDIIILQYCSVEKEFWTDYSKDFLWARIESIEADGVNILGLQGKVIENNFYFKNLIGEGTDHPLPVTFETLVKEKCEATYFIGGTNVDDFDPRKLHLVKSIEISQFSQYPLASWIVYDRIEIDVNNSLYNLCIDSDDTEGVRVVSI